VLNEDEKCKPIRNLPITSEVTFLMKSAEMTISENAYQDGGTSPPEVHAWTRSEVRARPGLGRKLCVGIQFLDDRLGPRFSPASFSHRLTQLIAAAKHAACTSIFLPRASGPGGLTCITSCRDFCIQHCDLEVCFGRATAGGAQ
jgi:hypothetical protein